jgi:hypothetical protein
VQQVVAVCTSISADQQIGGLAHDEAERAHDPIMPCCLYREGAADDRHDRHLGQLRFQPAGIPLSFGAFGAPP